MALLVLIRILLIASVLTAVFAVSRILGSLIGTEIVVEEEVIIVEDDDDHDDKIQAQPESKKKK